MEAFREGLIGAVLSGKQARQVPVWAMRQAGRVLSSYRALRAQVGGFKELVTTPSLAAEATMLPIRDLGVDAAIIFSDILVIPEAMGFPYEMEEGRGPYFERYIRGPKDVELLQVENVEKGVGYVLEALRMVRSELSSELPLIGFSGAPWTLLAYLLEGGGSKHYGRARGFLYAHPEAAHEALQRLTDGVVMYLRAQRAHGADMLQLFDTLAEVLPPKLYAEFGLPYVLRVVEAVAATEAGCPLMLFVKGGRMFLPQLSRLPCAGLSIDWMTPLAEAASILDERGMVLQGNFDPALLYGPRTSIETAVRTSLRLMEGKRYVANLGHGLYPDLPEENVRYWVEAIHAYPERP